MPPSPFSPSPAQSVSSGSGDQPFPPQLNPGGYISRLFCSPPPPGWPQLLGSTPVWQADIQPPAARCSKPSPTSPPVHSRCSSSFKATHRPSPSAAFRPSSPCSSPSPPPPPSYFSPPPSLRATIALIRPGTLRTPPALSASSPSPPYWSPSAFSFSNHFLPALQNPYQPNPSVHLNLELWYLHPVNNHKLRPRTARLRQLHAQFWILSRPDCHAKRHRMPAYR